MNAQQVKPPDGAHGGFTLVEVMIALGVSSLILAGAISVFLMCRGIWHSTSLKMQTAREANMAMTRLVYGPGRHNGLRSAAAIVVVPYAHGSWAGGSYPPPANSNHNISTGGTPDGSWRIAFSNSFDGLRWIDYNRAASNIVYWPDVGDDSSRVLICNYVTDSSVQATDEGVSIALAVARRDGRFTATSHVATFVMKRNR